MINLSSFIRFHAERTPDRTAIVYGPDRISYGDLRTRIEQTAGWLTARGVAAGDVVAILMKNSAAFVEIAFAVSHVGAVFLPVNYRLAADEVAYIVANSGARLLVADAELATATQGADTEVVFVAGAAQADSTRLWGDAPARPAPMSVRRPDDLFRLMYTSGTTDRPKGVMHSYANFYWKCADHMIALQLNGQVRLFVGGPLYHVGAFDLPGMAVLWAGGMLHIQREFEAGAALAAIEKERLTAAWLAPVMTSLLLSHPQRDRYDVSSVEWVIGGGERTPESRIRGFSEFFRNGRYIDAYGLTESCSGDTLMEAGREIEKIGSVGRALAHVEIAIMDDEGAALPGGAEGEICLRGPKVTRGYWRDPAKTAASFHGDWFRTGDVGYLDDQGFLYLTDRKKDMIISGGENIASSEVERAIYEMPQVAEVAVIGVPDPRWGETPAAFIVLAGGASLDLDGLRTHCASRLAGFKIPKKLFIREALPRNPSGKVLKRILRDEIVEYP